MLSERNLNRRVIQEIINYFFSIGANGLVVQADMDHGRLGVQAAATLPERSAVDLAQLRAALNNGRKAEVEGYYAQLIGVDQTDNDLDLLGDLIDWGEVELQDRVLKLSVYRE